MKYLRHIIFFCFFIDLLVVTFLYCGLAVIFSVEYGSVGSLVIGAIFTLFGIGFAFGFKVTFGIRHKTSYRKALRKGDFEVFDINMVNDYCFEYRDNIYRCEDFVGEGE